MGRRPFIGASGKRRGQPPLFSPQGDTVPRAPRAPRTVGAQLAELRVGQLVLARTTDGREVHARIVRVGGTALELQPLGWRGQRLTIVRDVIESVEAAMLDPKEHDMISRRQCAQHFGPDGVPFEAWAIREID